MKSKIIGSVVTLSVLAAIVLTLMNNKAKSTAKASQSDVQTSIPVSVITVEKKQLSENLSLTGTITANNDVNIASETQGRITGVHAKVGDYVHAGATIAQVDDELKQANLLSADANFQKAKADYDRTASLWKEKAVTDAQHDAARLMVKTAEAQLIIARRQLKDTRITAPIQGFLTSRPVDVGVNVQNGMVIGTVVDITKLKVKVNVAESDAFTLKVHDNVRISTEVYPGVLFTGKISNIAVKADEAHTYPVEIVLENNKHHPLKAGMFARLDFTSLQRQPSVVVPREAILGGLKDASVFIIENGASAKLRSVVTGAESGRLVEIIRGVQEGETIVINGQNNLKHGAIVTVVK